MPRRQPIAIAALVAATALVLLAEGTPAGAGGGRVTQVLPGQLQEAISEAARGDTLLIHPGHYRGAYTIEKPLRLVGIAGKRRPLIDGRCRTRVTIAVRSAGVILRRLHVVGADEGFGSIPSEVDFSGVANGRASDLFVRDTCDAEYGINVFGSPQVDMIDNRGRGFSDAAFYVGGISTTNGGTLLVKGNDGFGSNRGIIVEDSAGGRIRIVDNRLHDNKAPGNGPPSGIFVHRSDAVELVDNVVVGNGRFGIHLAEGSDRNRLFRNTVRRNPGGNFLDEGDGNCGAGNRPNPFPPC